MKLLSVKWKICLLIVGVIVSCCCADAFAEDSSSTYRLETAFIYNFMKFTNWHDTRLSDKNESLHIVVVDGNPFGDALQPLTGKKVSGHSIQVTFDPEFLRSEHLTSAQVVFVSDRNLADVDRAIAKLQHRHLLTVGDTPGFAAHGGCIELRKNGGRMSFIINRKAVENQGITLSYQVYNLAAEVLGKD